MTEKLEKFEKSIGYKFCDRNLLIEALTHSSYIRETKEIGRKSNERLEFLGDAYLDAISGEEIFKRLYDYDEGKLTKIRASVVCEKSLAVVGRKLDIGEYLDMGAGASKNGDRYRPSIIADAVEALIGAIYLDGGYEKCKEFVLDIMREILEDAILGKVIIDYKSHLQEKAQAYGNSDIEYRVIREEGPDHDKSFYVSVSVNGTVLGYGEGKTKKEAERNAAGEALERGY